MSPADSDQSVTVEWEEVECYQRNGLVIGYSLKYSTTLSGNWISISNEDNMTNRTVSGLMSSTQYFFKVAAINDAGQGVYSNLTNYTTPGHGQLTPISNITTALHSNYTAPAPSVSTTPPSVPVVLIACGSAGGIAAVVIFIFIIAIICKVHRIR